MRVLGLKNCDKTRAAMKALKERGHDPVLVDIRAEPLGADERAAILAAFGDKAVNRSSTTWRGLSDDEKARPVAGLLQDHPALLKRPVIEVGGSYRQGL
ncbi:arsenate reductase-like glutaredoxin family protein [Limimaricola variabilis]|uniref:Arsenate reductase-like glutaredoxin family protein n=1 Tax=Limimaricola variabilis TaxID=1492771 RepID=A0ABR6HNP3_9RHOB|nr:ArsC/Spx/MgsR family protein [Limimaricola variabilis]MBB3712172.1 arsenate reductase-like glutaredoxin family protein [Limimaricola variabilis]